MAINTVHMEMEVRLKKCKNVTETQTAEIKFLRCGKGCLILDIIRNEGI
jgi:hypothetical protein